MTWELIWMLVILKIQVIYICLVVWWAVRAKPNPYEGAALSPVAVDPDPRSGWSRRSRTLRPRRGGPHGSPQRVYARRAATVVARAAEAE